MSKTDPLAALKAVRASAQRIGTVNFDAAAAHVSTWAHSIAGCAPPPVVQVSTPQAIIRAARDARALRLAVMGSVAWVDTAFARKMFARVSGPMRQRGWLITRGWERELWDRVSRGGHAGVCWHVDMLTNQVANAIHADDDEMYRRWVPIAKALAAGAYCFWIGGDAIHLVMRPSKATQDDEERLHNPSGPAFVWGTAEEYWWHGVRVPETTVMRSHELTIYQINGERNQERRRVMVERFGYDRYMKEMHGERIDHSEGFGTLWVCPAAPNESEDLFVVEVINSTREPDGTFKHYWLRVPPTVRSAREAVAWTFGLTGRYAPLVET